MHQSDATLGDEALTFSRNVDIQCVSRAEGGLALAETSEIRMFDLIQSRQGQGFG